MSAPSNLRTKVIFGVKCLAVSDTGLHLRPDTFLYSKKNVCILGAKVLLVCQGVEKVVNLFVFAFICLCSGN